MKRPDTFSNTCGDFEVAKKTSAESNKTGSSQVGAISKAQKYSKNNYWKHLEKLFSKKIFEFFFSKKVFFLENRTMPKNSKRGHSGSLNVFTNRKLQKNARGYPLIESGKKVA